MAITTRVLKRRPSSDTLKTLAVGASLAGVALYWVDRWLQGMSGDGDLVGSFALAFALYLAPPMALGAWTALTYASFRWATVVVLALLAAYYGFAGLLLYLPEFFACPYSGWTARPLGHFAGLLALEGALGFGAFLLTWMPVRLVLVGAIEQTGTLCGRCAYELAGLPSPVRCPECGFSERLRQPTPLRRIASMILAKRGWTLVTLAFFGAVGVEYSRWSRFVRSDLERLAAFGEVQAEPGELMLTDPSSPVPFVFARTAVRPLDEASGTFLILALPTEPRVPCAAAQLYVGVRIETAPGFSPYRRTSPLVYCDLSKEELKSLESGLPPGMEEALRQQARAAGVRPFAIQPHRGLVGNGETTMEVGPPAVPIEVRFADYH